MNAFVDRVKKILNSPKSGLIIGVTSVVAMVASAPLFSDGLRGTVGSIKTRQPFKVVIRHAVKMLPMLLFAASAVMSFVAMNGMYNSLAAQAGKTISQLSAVAAAPAATIVEKATEELETATTDKDTSQGSAEVQHLGDGEYVFVESITGQKFTSTVEEVKRCLNDINAAFLRDGCITVGELRYLLPGEFKDTAVDWLEYRFDGNTLRTTMKPTLTPDGSIEINLIFQDELRRFNS